MSLADNRFIDIVGVHTASGRSQSKDCKFYGWPVGYYKNINSEQRAMFKEVLDFREGVAAQRRRRRFRIRQVPSAAGMESSENPGHLSCR